MRVVGGVSAAVVVCALVVAAVSLVLAALDRPPGPAQLVAVGVVEVALLVQAVLAVVRLAGGAHAAQPLVFVLYVVASLLVLPVGAAWAVLERSRWGTAVPGAACLVIAVMQVRLGQTWNG